MHKSAWEIACAKGRDLIIDQVGWIYKFELLKTDFSNSSFDNSEDSRLNTTFENTNYVGYGGLNLNPEDSLKLTCIRLKRVDEKMNC